MSVKLGFISFTYWRIDSNDFMKQSIHNFDEVIFFDLRNLFPKLASNEENSPFSEDKLPYPPLKFETIKLFERYLEENKIIVINGFGEQKFSRWRLSYILNKYNVPMIGIQSNSGLRNILGKSMNTQVKKKSKIENIINKFYFLLYLLLLKSNILSKYDTYFLSGKKISNIITKYKTKYNEVVYINSHVYDKFLTQKDDKIDNNTIVFLDVAVPFLADFKKWGMNEINPENYYKQLNDFFDLLENITDKKVVVCAHPQFNYKQKDIYFPNREVVWFKTNEYISKASFVLIHYTNAIQYGVLNNKPILLLDDINLNQYLRLSMDYCEKVLGLRRINYTSISKSELQQIIDLNIVNKVKYEQFKTDYLINSGDENITSVEKITNILKKKYKL